MRIKEGAKSKVMQYTFEKITNCEMCGDSTDKHKILGQRMNQSQGLNPRNKAGISVSVQKCNSCNLIYSQPLSIPHNIQDHYGKPPEEYWKSEYFDWNPSYFSDEIKIVKNLMDFERGMNALDIGCGLGKCMKSLEQAGFNVYGIESSETFYQKAITEMGIQKEKIHLGMLEEIELNEKFDFITFGAVLEHLYHPAKALEKAFKWLNKGGIVQVEVPSSNHLIPKLINTFYRLKCTNYVTHLSPMHSPYHLYEFDLESFKSMSKRMNYEIAEHHYYVCSIYHMPKILHPMFRWYMRKNNMGMQLAVYLRKIT